MSILFRIGSIVFQILFFHFLLQYPLFASDWPSWRGINQNGTSRDKGLVSNWSVTGENLIWKTQFAGRSTPIVMNGLVYVIGRVGKNMTMQEQVACFDAENGKMKWEHRYNVRNSYAPFSRIGWASMVGDPETGNVYSVGTGGILHCFSKDGNILWSRSMIEDFAARTGYGGRTTTPVIDEDLVIIGFVSAGWGDQKPMKHRHFAFDKRSGEVVWISTPGGIFKAPNIYSNPVIAIIDDQRLFIAGNADGNVYALKARTGEKVWEFHLSKRGLNSSILVDGNRIYAAHSEENIDTPTMGRIVCIDGRGKGDITKTNELWRYPAEIGYTTPMIHAGRIYYIDNVANLIALDAMTGEKFWNYSLGTVGKGSPVWADDKIYVPETNGRFHILEPGSKKCLSVDLEQIKMPDGRNAEIYGSPAIAYGRIYFTTEEGLYCIGDRDAKFQVTNPTTLQLADESQSDKNSSPSYIQVLPAEIIAGPGNDIQYTARAFDENGRFLKQITVKWDVSKKVGQINKTGILKVNKGDRASAGIIKAMWNGLSGTARIRIFPALPWTEDFTTIEDGQNPMYWLGAGSARSPGGKFIVKTVNGNKVLAKPTALRGIQRHVTFIGPSTMSNYTIQVDAMDHKYKRKRGDAGLISHGYTLDLMGKKQLLEIRSWGSENRIKETVEFKWEPEKWYTIKLAVDFQDEKAMIKGKVWPADETEPGEWTIQTNDLLPIKNGSPGIYGVSYTEVFFDNVKVTKN